MNKIRIIGGQLRSRQITVLDEKILRPTPNRIRETLFNWLRDDIAGANCLDLFAGSGALGFEALSRGASHVTFIEHDKKIMDNLQKNAAHLNLSPTFIETDALSFLQKTPEKSFDIIFLDPPYAANLILPCLTLLTQHHFLSDRAHLYIEHNQPLTAFTFPKELTLLKHKKAGQVYYGLLIY